MGLPVCAGRLFYCRKGVFMILRRWHGRVPNAKAADYLHLMTTVALPDYRATPGIIDALCCSRVEGDVTHIEMMTLWESEDAIRAFAGDMVLRAKYYDNDAEYLLEMEDEVLHFEAMR